MKSPRKIVFEGFYGFKNAGDDAFVEIASWGSQEYWNCFNNVFIGASLPVTSVPINQKQILKTVKGFDRVNMLSHLRNSDYMVSAGGSTFGGLPFHSNKAIANYSRSLNKKLKLGAIGVSVGPFKSKEDERAVINYLNSLNFVALRDKRSFDYVSSLNLPYMPVNAFDLAALLPLLYKKPSKKVSGQEKTIGLSICNYESYTGGNIEKERSRNNYFKEVVTLLEKQKNVRFKVFIINGNKRTGDKEVSLKLTHGIPPSKVEIIPYSGNVKKTWNEISSCDIMISTRLHASIFACYSNVPFLLIEYHKKCGDFLTDVGQDEKYRLYDAEVSPMETLSVIKEILSGNFIKPENILETIARSKRNFTETIPKL